VKNGGEKGREKQITEGRRREETRREANRREERNICDTRREEKMKKRYDNNP
jgi:hypothetical protein